MARTFTGVVVSDKASKTIVVSVPSSKTHPLYRKQYIVHKKFMAHDEKEEAHVGDSVTIVETRPISARKFFKLQSINERAKLSQEDKVEAVVAEPQIDETETDK